MRILLVVPGGVDRGGQERVIPALLWLIERLARRHQVAVVALNQYIQPCAYPLLGAQVFNLGLVPSQLPPWSLIVALRRMSEALSSLGWRPQIVHAFWAGKTGLLAGLCARQKGVPLVLSLGGGELVWLPEIRYGLQGRLSSRLQVNLSLHMAQTITAGSRFMLDLLPNHFQQTRYIPLGINLGVFYPPERHSQAPPWRLLHVASVNRVKDPETLLRAVAVVRKEVEVGFDWVGENVQEMDIPGLIARLGLVDVVRFHGFLPVHELAPFYHGAHLFVQASRHESQGVAVCEAAASGLPTAGTKVGLVAELSPHAALSVPVGDAAALAQAILSLLEDADRRARMGQAALTFARTYDADWTANQFEELYEGLLH